MIKMKKKIISIALSLAVAATTFSSLSVVAFAKDEVEIPEAAAVYDFSYNFEELAEQDPGFSVVENGAKPELVQDEEMGQVLKLNKAVIGERKFATKNGEVTGYLISDESEYSQIDISNPFEGKEFLKEYEPWEDVETTVYRSKVQPKWKEGITITYWIKTPAGEDGYGLNSNVVGFTSNRFQMQSDDYAKYLCTVKYDIDCKKLTDEEKEFLGPHVVRAGVNIDSDFYFEYATEELYGDKPIYLEPKDHAVDGTDPNNLDDHMGKTYWMNKNFVEGVIKTSDGKVISAGGDGRYADWCEAPTLGDTADDHDCGDSRIRYAWTYSEMWLDASSSFYFENDSENVNKQLNKNLIDSYDTYVGMQHGDSFNINSWKLKSTVAEADAEGLAADSPVTQPDEWHMVTCVIENDWVTYYLDDEEIEMEDCYGSYGWNGYAETLGNYKPWKRFNKGTGSRYGYGTERKITYWCYYGNFCAPTMMEWIIMDCVNAKIGGGNVAGDGYGMYADTDEVQIKNVVFYDKKLTDDQIEFLYENPYYYDKKNQPVESDGLLGDVDLNEAIDASDALLVLKHAVKLTTLTDQPAVNADVNVDAAIDANDALEILKYAAGLISEFTPAEAPTV